MGGRSGSDILMLAPAGQALNSVLAPEAELTLSLTPISDTSLSGVGTDMSVATRGPVGIPGGGYLPPTTNAAGGTVYTTVGDINGVRTGSVVLSASLQGANPINIISGVDGFANGTVLEAPEFFTSDLNMFGNVPNVTVYNFADVLESGELNSLLNGPGVTICAFCNSGAVINNLSGLGDVGESGIQGLGEIPPE